MGGAVWGKINSRNLSQTVQLKLQIFQSHRAERGAVPKALKSDPQEMEERPSWGFPGSLTSWSLVTLSAQALR